MHIETSADARRSRRHAAGGDHVGPAAGGHGYLAAAAGSGKISAGMFDGHILRREESDKVVQHANFAVFEAAVGRGDFTQARSLLAIDRANEFGWLLQRCTVHR